MARMRVTITFTAEVDSTDYGTHDPFVIGRHIDEDLFSFIRDECDDEPEKIDVRPVDSP